MSQRTNKNWFLCKHKTLMLCKDREYILKNKHLTMFFNLINADKCNKNNNDTVAFNLPNIHYIFLSLIITDAN
ncbi:Uncharacterised protein [uncultured Prevotella sp.]|nr:Uncharacterised protein [uncultured Prevotella sp.]